MEWITEVMKIQVTMNLVQIVKTNIFTWAVFQDQMEM